MSDNQRRIVALKLMASMAVCFLIAVLCFGCTRAYRFKRGYKTGAGDYRRMAISSSTVGSNPWGEGYVRGMSAEIMVQTIGKMRGEIEGMKKDHGNINMELERKATPQIELP